MKLFLTIIIAAMQFLIVILPLKGKMSDENLRFPHLTGKGKLLVLCCIITLIATVWLYSKVENDENTSRLKFERELKIELKKANDSYTTKIDSSNKTTIEILAKYGLKVDSAQTRIEKLVKDSTNVVTKIYNSEDPEFAMYKIETIKRTADTLKIKIFFTSNDATSYKVNFKMDIAILDLKGKLKMLVKDFNMLAPNLTLSKDKTISYDIDFPKPNYHSIVFRMKGTYYKFDNKKFNLDRLYSYEINKETPTFGVPSSLRNDEMKAFFQNK
ncbi:hypothetical protein [Flavobacterium sp. CF136]|uniref:hypothetical protein n=1 Tax=Flavobacterium sp. (strain CF136) TaxID=1144313 RepID=UPI0002719F4B|nr:hypothetical protein [Flavobacterium sp. CF136]EJL64757.1 hypothetical protein PMI10_01734 [Flavobacterium sp. CF136]